MIYCKFFTIAPHIAYDGRTKIHTIFLLLRHRQTAGFDQYTLYISMMTPEILILAFELLIYSQVLSNIILSKYFSVEADRQYMHHDKAESRSFDSLIRHLYGVELNSILCRRSDMK